MSKGNTFASATLAVDYMHSIKFNPGTIINVGVGSAPEMHIWGRRLRNVQWLGIDPRDGSHFPKGSYYRNIVAAEEGKVFTYCWKCMAIGCNQRWCRRHGRHVQMPPSRTIDSIMAEAKKPGPYFMWMDIEGSEIEALKGAVKTLPQTPIISVEIRDFAFKPDHSVKLKEYLNLIGYSLVDLPYGKLEDRLYQRNDYMIKTTTNSNSQQPNTPSAPAAIV